MCVYEDGVRLLGSRKEDANWLQVDCRLSQARAREVYLGAEFGGRVMELHSRLVNACSYSSTHSIH